MPLADSLGLLNSHKFESPSQKLEVDSFGKNFVWSIGENINLKDHRADRDRKLTSIRNLSEY